MRCAEFRDRLDAIVARTLGSADSARADAHVRTCAACSALLRVANGEENPLHADAANGLVGRVLQETIGTSQCARAQERLSAHLDVPADPVDARLMTMHLEHCAACTAMARALALLRLDAPALATWSPDAGFVGAVLAATSRRPQITWAASWRRRWQQWTARPRLAWELAYGATLVVALLAGPPSAPLHQVPRQALALVQVDPHSLAAASARLGTRAADLGQSLWDATGGELQARARAGVETFGATHPQLHVAWQDLQRHVVELGSGLRDADIGRIRRSLEQIGSDLIAMCRGFLSRTGARSA
jgi:predicted anti-sigma-YlaC factor YlaD